MLNYYDPRHLLPPNPRRPRALRLRHNCTMLALAASLILLLAALFAAGKWEENN